MKLSLVYRIVGLYLFFLFLISLADASAQQPRYHIVQPQETVYSIAKRYNLSIHDIYKLNPSSKEKIRSGEKLILPDSSTLLQQGRNGKKTHTIVKGETLYSVCRRYGVSEELMMITNPGLTPRNFKIGDVITIPEKNKRDTIIAKSSGGDDEHASKNIQVHNRQVKVALLLPLSKGAPSRYMEFYEGFLMGLYDLKKNGVSVDLVVKDVASLLDIQRLERSLIFEDRDLVIGGTGDDQIEYMAKTVGQALYVVPFSSREKLAMYSSKLYQVNSPQDLLYKEVLEGFLSQYKNHKIYLANADQVDTDGFYDYLKRYLDKNSIDYRMIDFAGDAAISIDSRAVIVPANQTPRMAERIFNKLGNSSCSIFASPRWQSFNSSLIRQMHKYNTTIYTSFFMDNKDALSVDFYTKYNAWFGHPIANTYPKYGAVGYDVARYFIRAIASYGADFLKYSYQIPSDGIQTDFKFRKVSSTGGYVNQNVFFVTYHPNGRITKTSL